MRIKDGIFRELEEKYAEFSGFRFGCAVNSGTSALTLALAAVGVGKGDEVIIPDFTMAACAFACSYLGATPITVDCTDRLVIDPKQIEAKITKKTKAIMAVHIYGRLCDMTEINRIATKFNLPVIEDACEAQGAKLGPATISCVSFYKNKIIHAEEGGMCMTNNNLLSQKMNYLKNMAFGEAHNYYHENIGFNFRMPDTTAKQVMKSLKKYPRNAEKRRKIESWFDQAIAPASRMPKRDAVWVYDFISKCPSVIKMVAKQLNIPIREFFKPISSFPMYSQQTGEKAQSYAYSGLYIPVNPNMSRLKVGKITKLI